MTKKIRVENADNSSHKVRLTVQEQHANGEWVTVRTKEMLYPCHLEEEYIHQTQRLVIEEIQ